jgi:hypothetical protein
MPMHAGGTYGEVCSFCFYHTQYYVKPPQTPCPTLPTLDQISSASDCTDYQSRRLNIRYKGKDKAKTQ